MKLKRLHKHQQFANKNNTNIKSKHRMKANNKWRGKKLISNNQTRQTTSGTVTMN